MADRVPGRIQIAVVSPGDVRAERARLTKVIEELNRGVARSQNRHLSLWRWETDSQPGLHPDGAQGIIDELMEIEDADLVIGIFWKRFGTPTMGSQSGTEHELRKAWAGWRSTGRPQVMVYFSTRAYSPGSQSELEQWARVLAFRDAMPEEQLWWPYSDPSAFERAVREHLTQFLLRTDSGRQPQTGSSDSRSVVRGEPRPLPARRERATPATGAAISSNSHSSRRRIMAAACVTLALGGIGAVIALGGIRAFGAAAGLSDSSNAFSACVVFEDRGRSSPEASSYLDAYTDLAADLVRSGDGQLFVVWVASDGDVSGPDLIGTLASNRRRPSNATARRQLVVAARREVSSKLLAARDPRYPPGTRHRYRAPIVEAAARCNGVLTPGDRLALLSSGVQSSSETGDFRKIGLTDAAIDRLLGRLVHAYLIPQYRGVQITGPLLFESSIGAELPARRQQQVLRFWRAWSRRAGASRSS